MKLCLPSTLVRVSPLIFVSTLFAKANPALSQASNIVPDNTLGEESSQVIENVDGQAIEVITGGAQREQNLFHSFQEFNVSEGRGAYFESPNVDIQNIFSRVTGSNPSEIMGVLGTFGESNPDLYLINPNGIIFGENAALDVQGSFTATTADGIRFGEKGEFGTINPQTSQLLTINPSAYLFNQIANQEINGIENQGILSVPQGENIFLLGGDINLIPDINMFGSLLVAPGGKIELGSVQGSAAIGLDEDLNLRFSETVERGNITISGGSLVNVTSEGGGFINIYGKNLEMTEGGVIAAGIGGVANPDILGGDISINLTEKLTLDNSFIVNLLAPNAQGTIGDIDISSKSISATNGGQISSLIRGKGNAGNININALDSITVEGESTGGNITRIGNLVEPGGEGNTGDVNVVTSSLRILSGAEISASTFGKGNAGSVTITATDSILFDGEGVNSNRSGVFSSVNDQADGNAGEVEITTNSLEVLNGARISTNTFGEGNAGSVTITATNSILFDGETNNAEDSGAFSTVDSTAQGNAGNINIDTGSLKLLNGTEIFSNTFGKGDAGSITINANDSILLDGEGSDGFPSRIASDIAPGGDGDGGDVNITTNSLKVLNGGQVSASTFGKGNAGFVTITATDLVFLDSPFSNSFPSGIFSDANLEAIGNGGDVNITTNSLILNNQSTVNTSTLGKGNAGNINIATNSLEVFNGGQISSATVGKGDAGSITTNVTNSTILDGESRITSQVNSQAEGNAGSVNISTDTLEVLNGAQISASTFGKGNASSVSITATDLIILDGETIDGLNSGIFSDVGLEAEGNAGDVNIATDSLEVINGAQISTNTFGEGNAGDVSINVTDSISLDGKGIDDNPSGVLSSVQSNGIGNAGSLSITTNSLFITNEAALFTGAFGQGKGGELQVKANSLNLDNNALISSRSETNFDAGNIILDITDSLQSIDSEISTSSTQSSGGNLAITAGNIKLRGNSDLTTDIASGEGSGGNINITTGSIIAFDDSDIFAFAADGQGGNITLDTPAFFAENFTLNSLTDNPGDLDLNARADVNATGAVSGAVDIPDVSFIQNSLTELPDNSLNTDELVANSCVVPAGNRSQGKFIITGGESLPVRPGDNLPSKYPTGEVRGVTEENTSSWQPGDPIIEPQGAYRLANGKLVLSRECSQ